MGKKESFIIIYHLLDKNFILIYKSLTKTYKILSPMIAAKTNNKKELL